MTDRHPAHHEIETVEEILETVDHAGTHRRTVSIGEIVDEIDGNAFPALMLLPALILISPLSGIPGMATTMGLLVALAAAQMIFRRRTFWLPAFLRRVTIRRTRLDRAVGWLEKIGAFLDRISARRLTALTEPPFSLLCAFFCLAIALVMPLFEIVPFSASTGGAAIAFFSLALVTGDGLMMLAALVATFGGGALIWWLAA